jgi:hypothetical protein
MDAYRTALDRLKNKKPEPRDFWDRKAPDHTGLTAERHDFLRRYRSDIEKLPPLLSAADDSIDALDAEQRELFTTLLPVAAAIQKEHKTAASLEIMELTKHYVITKIDALLEREAMEHGRTNS